jgi:alginate O-acetyltransferase complex protein AlgJ
VVPSRPPYRRRIAKALATLVACGFVFGPGIAALLGLHSTSIENRELAKPPRLDQGWDALDALTAWASDNLSVRNAAVHANAWVDYNALQEIPPAGLHAKDKIDPLVVRGKDGYLFLGEDFARACDLSKQFDPALEQILGFARTIQATGRNVVVVVGPNKSSVAPEALPRSVPRGDCALTHMRAQEARLDATTDPLFLNLLPQLKQAQAGGGQPYWKTDTHWGPNGSAIYAQGLATKLSPSLGATLPVNRRPQTFTGDLGTMIGLPMKESDQVNRVETGTVRQDPYNQEWVLQGVYYGMQHWTTTPSTGLVQGKTLFLGDSFNYYAMDNLRPLFADGTSIWMRTTSNGEVARHIAAADTIVLETVQRSVDKSNAFLRPKLATAVTKELAKKPYTPSMQR